MDCYPEYKQHIHPTHQTYNNNAAAGNHPYYPGNYGTPSMRYAHAHAHGESGQQQNWIDGYARYNQGQHHLSSHGNFSNSFNGHYGAMRENFHPSNEAREQFYYQNATSSSYYGNHSYDTYRNASSNYHYHYGSGNGGGNYNQSASHPTQYYQPSYSASPEQFNNRYYPTPPPSAPPAQRDPYTLPHSIDRAVNFTPSIDSCSNEKLIERLSADACKGSSTDHVVSSPSSPVVAQTSTERVDADRKSEVQQMKLEESSLSSALLGENDKTKLDCPGESVKVEENLDSEIKEPKYDSHCLQHTSIFNEHSHQHQRHPSNERLPNVEDPSIKETENSVATGKRPNKTRFSSFPFS